jgi:hypothetical protein
MANITNHSLVADLRLQQMISQEIKLLITDARNLRNTPFLDFVGSINGNGSDTIRVRKAGLDGYDSFQAFTGASGSFQEDTAVGETSLTDGHADIVVKRNALMYKITDLASMTGIGGSDIDPFRIAESISKSYELLFAELTGATVAGFTASVTQAGALTVDDFILAFQQLELASSGKGAPGPYVALLHPEQWQDLQADIRSETNNALAFAPASYEAMSAKGPGYKGSYLGVDIYTSSHITDSAGNHVGALWAPGAIGFATGKPAALVGAAESMDMGDVLIEMDRDATRALTSIVGHCYLGMGVVDSDRGVKLLSLND